MFFLLLSFLWCVYGQGREKGGWGRHHYCQSQILILFHMKSYKYLLQAARHFPPSSLNPQTKQLHNNPTEKSFSITFHRRLNKIECTWIDIGEKQARNSSLTWERFSFFFLLSFINVSPPPLEQTKKRPKNVSSWQESLNISLFLRGGGVTLQKGNK